MAQSTETKLNKRFDQNIEITGTLDVGGNAEITGTLTVGGNSVLTTSNNINADKLDNLDSTQFLRSDATDYTTGNLLIGASATPEQALEVRGNILLGANNTAQFIHSGGSMAFSADTNIMIVVDSNDTDGAAPSGEILFGAGTAINTNADRGFTYDEAYPSNVPRLLYGKFDGSGNFDITGGSLEMNGTTVINSSRNITAGTISGSTGTFSSSVSIESSASSFVGLTVGTSADSYVRQDFKTDTIGAATAYLIAYGSANPNDGSIAIKSNASHTTTNGTAGDIWFATGASSTERMRIKGDGSISMTNSLSVDGDVTFGGDLLMDFSGTTYSDAIIFRGVADSAGEVGIRANGEGLEIYEPEDNNKVWLTIADDPAGNDTALQVNSTSGMVPVLHSINMSSYVTTAYIQSQGFLRDTTDTFTGTLTLNGAQTINGSGNGLTFSGGNNRIVFGAYRALEGTTTASTLLQVGESYATTRLYGNVGIDTSSPDSRLHIYKEDSSPVLLTLENYVSDIDGDGGVQGNFIDFKTSDANVTSQPQARIGMLVKDYTGENGISSEGDGNLVFYTNDGTDDLGNGTLSEVMRLTHQKRVGIGTDSPVGKLTISENVNSTADFSWLVFDNQASGYGDWNIYKSGNNNLAFGYGTSNGSSYTNALTLEYGGNVGIGTDSPTETLDVRGSVKIGKDGVSPYLTFDEAPDSTAGSEFYLTHDISGNILKFTDDNSNDFIAMDRDNGNVGIGTTDPSAKLEVAGDINITGGGNNRNIYINHSNFDFRATTTSGWAFGLRSYTNDGSTIMSYAAGAFGAGPLSTDFQYNFYGGTAYNNAAMYIPANKNVGIGTISPAQKLEVKGTTRITRNTDSNTYLDVTVADVSCTFSGYDSDGWMNYAFNSNGTNRLFINGSSGNVGIGTTNPSAKLEVVGEAWVGNGTDGIKLSYSAGNSTGIVDTEYTSTGLEFRVGGSEKVRIDSSGVTNFKSGSSTNDNVRFYNQDGKYSYIRQTAASNSNNVWFDGTLGAIMWYAWDNPGNLRTAGVYTRHMFGSGRGTGAEIFTINRANISGTNSSSTTTYQINPQGDSYFNGGNVGIGTTSPSAKLHLSSIESVDLRIDADTDNAGSEDHNPRLVLTQDGGGIESLFGINGNANAQFTGALANGAYWKSNASIQFATSNTIAATIDTSQRLGLGLVSPSYLFHMYGSSPEICIDNTAESQGGLLFRDAQAPASQWSRIAYDCSDNHIKFRYGNGVTGEGFRFTNTGTFYAAADIVAYYSFSDARLKTNVKPLQNSLEKVKQLQGVSYEWIDGERKGKTEVGLIAQEVEKVVPEVVREQKRLGDDTKYKTVDYEKLTAVLIEAVKELTNKVEELENKLNGTK